MLGKENTKEQVIDNQSRLIRMQKEDTLLSSSQQILQLPEGFTRGKAIGGGDCFFDAVAQGLKQLKPEMNFTVKSLREVCKKKALSSQEMKEKIIADARNSEDPTIALPEPDIDEDKLWNAYLASIEYTAEDTERMEIQEPHLYESLTNLKYGSTLQIPIWGRPEIEGSMICNEYNIKLHVIEGLSMCGWSDQLVDGLASRSIDYVDYSEENTIHIINKGGGHFEPILRKTVQQILPHCYDTMVSEKKSDSKSVYFQQVSENEMTDNQMDWEISSTNVEVSHAESTIVDYENRLSSEELQYKQSQGNPIRSRVESSSSTSKDISDSALTDCRSTVDDVGLTDDEITKKATLFVKTFVGEFEEKLSQCYEEVKPGSKVRKSGMIIDQVDSTIKSAVPAGKLRVVCDMAVGIVGHFSATEHRKKAKKVCAVSTHHKNERRKILVDASLEIFQSFEEQFTKIVDSVSPCWEMGIRKLAIDAVDRVMNYISANEKDEFSVDLITKGVVLGESKRGTFAKQALQSFKLRVRQSNYQVQYKQSNEILITSQIYRNAGIKREYTDAIDYYAPKKCSYAEKCGYRLPFRWELEEWDKEVKPRYVFIQSLCLLSKSPKERNKYILSEEKNKELADRILKEIDGEEPAQKKDITEMHKNLQTCFGEDKNTFSFHLDPLPALFIEREELEKLISMLDEEPQSVEISRKVLIYGKLGTGKSELAKSCAYSQKSGWKKVACINAATYSALLQSFHELAKELKISINGQNAVCERKIESIVRDVYKNFRDTKSLFIFYNASSDEKIEKLLPSYFSDLFFCKEKPYVLITSCDKNWKEEIKKIDLNEGFLLEEAIKFIRKALNLCGTLPEDVYVLAKTLNCYPLALKQATTCIKQTNLSISEYLKHYDNVKKEANINLSINSSIGMELYITSKVSLNLIEKTEEIGKQALSILGSISYLSSDQIDTTEIYNQQKTIEDKQHASELFAILEKFGMISLNENGNAAKIHEGIQETIRVEEEKMGIKEETLRKIMTLLIDNKCKSITYIIYVWSHASRYSKLVNDFIESDYDGSNILHLLAIDGNEKVIELILEKVHQSTLSKIVNIFDKDGFTSLEYAVRYGHLKTVKYLMEKMGDFDLQSHPLHSAALYGQQKIVEYFVDNLHYDCNELDVNGHSPLYYAMLSGYLNIIQYLIGKGATLDLEDGDSIYPVHSAVLSSRIEVVKYFVDNLRYDFNVLDVDGHSPLYYAKKHGYSNIAQYLVEKGATMYPQGYVPLHNDQYTSPKRRRLGTSLSSYGAVNLSLNVDRSEQGRDVLSTPISSLNSITVELADNKSLRGVTSAGQVA